MDFTFTPEEDAFRADVKTFLASHPAASFPIEGMDGGYGSGGHSHAFLRAAAEQGWITMTWPARYGGSERPFFLKLILLEELALAGMPFGPLVAVDQVSDALIRYGSEQIQADLLPRIARGELIFWQGFSEPEAGSDLLSLRTHAQRTNTGYVINGHKIWSSHAGICQFGLVLARTDADSPKRHQGISMFVVSNDTPGLDIRPIRSMAGAVYHYEVFLDDVAVPQGYLLGGENEGFTQMLKGLDSDRFWGRFYKPPTLKRLLSRLVEFANTHERRGRPLAADDEIRRRFASLATDIEALRQLFWRVGWMIKQGHPTPYETSLGKVYADETGQKVAAFAMELLGMYGTLQAGSPWEQLDGEIRHLYLTSMGQTIAGGTSEVLRSTVATRGLGLPRGPRAK
jgi:alkylation response protein AidB-like acyl-CoA dehydrogenase